jgi:hypothetical protein
MRQHCYPRYPRKIWGREERNGAAIRNDSVSNVGRSNDHLASTFSASIARFEGNCKRPIAVDREHALLHRSALPKTGEPLVRLAKSDARYSAAVCELAM